MSETINPQPTAATAQQSLPRIDEAEENIAAAQKRGTFAAHLSGALIEELQKAGLLQALIHNRLEDLLKGWISRADTELEATNDDNENNPTDSEPDTTSLLAHEWFGDQVDRRYLERRDALERVSFRILRTPSKGVALEAHQRLIGAEESWPEISDRWGQRPERDHQGRYAPTAPAQLTPELTKALRRLQPGELSEPIRIGKQFAIIELIQWHDVDLDKTLRAQLEKEMLAEWKKRQTDAITDHLLRGEAQNQ